jgi:hypothetical protein
MECPDLHDRAGTRNTCRDHIRDCLCCVGCATGRRQVIRCGAGRDEPDTRNQQEDQNQESSHGYPLAVATADKIEERAMNTPATGSGQAGKLGCEKN